MLVLDDSSNYYVLGYPTANPCEPIMPMQSIPDHTAVTVIGVEDNTTVQVITTHAIMASGGCGTCQVQLSEL